MRITLSGDLGSGKSSVGRRLSELLGIRYVSAGELFREIGQISNMDALATNLAAETNTDIDAKVDARTQQLDRDEPDFIIDSRMAWHFVTNAVRVFLSVRPETAAERIAADQTRKGERYADTQSALEMLRNRRQSELKRYRRLYDVNIEDETNYDLWIITDDAGVDDVCEIIQLFALLKTPHRRWIPKTHIVPMVRLPQAAAPRSPTAGDDASALPLVIARNYGLFLDDPQALASALRHERLLVPYRPEAPALLGASGDPLETAKQRVSAGSLSDWEKAFGVEFAFRRCIDAAQARAGLERRA
jgi:cytidylate kinase